MKYLFFTFQIYSYRCLAQSQAVSFGKHLSQEAAQQPDYAFEVENYIYALNT